MNKLGLLLARHDTHEPVLESASASDITEALHSQTGARDDLEGMLRSVSADRDHLGYQGYCVLVPEGARGERLLKLVGPLLALRGAEMAEGGPPNAAVNAAPEIVRVPVPRRDRPELEMDQAIQWVKREFEPPGKPDSQIPYYRLILGDLHEIPLAIQQALSMNGLAGRLAFDNDDEYAAYAEKVVAWHQRPTRAPFGSVIMHTADDRSPEILQVRTDVVENAIARLRFEFECGHGGDIKVTGERLGTTELCDITRATGVPNVLFTLSHGEGPPESGWASARQQRAFQGALSLARDARLCGADIERCAILPGGVWFSHACYSAGTPRTSAYAPWLRALRAHHHYRGAIDEILRGLPVDDRPFIAALPRAALANPDGPLAFIGHVDLAWTYSFGDIHDSQGARSQLLSNLITSLTSGHRVGVAFHILARYLYYHVHGELAAIDAAVLQGGQQRPARYAHLGMLRSDLSGYVLLGDPAVHLPVARHASSTRAPASARTTESQTGSPTSRAATSLAVIERAIGQVLDGVQPGHAARRAQLQEAELCHWVEIYRRAGRAALAKERRFRSRDEGE